MRRIFRLAWKYVAFHKIKTTILTASLTLSMVLPLTAHLLITYYGRSLTARAEATPLVVGAKGNRFDLVLKSLYFTTADVDPVFMAEVDAIRGSGLALPIPLHVRYTARRHPVVGTTLDYFDFRGLRVGEGTPPLRLGEAVLGATAAAELGLRPGDTLLTDQQNLYDITQTYPLKMHVTGVLAPHGTPDDRAVFTDVRTAWIIEGIMHGHRDVVSADATTLILSRKDGNVTASDAVVAYNEVTAENIDSFHTHAKLEELPLSAIIVVPTDAKSATLIKARYGFSKDSRMFVPRDVIEELLGMVFRVKRFFDANFALVLVSTGLFLALVVLLSQRIRRREMETMHKIGCSRGMAFGLQAAELVIVLSLSVVLATSVSMVALWAAPRFVKLL